jgi:hypothetical protein
VPFADCGGDNEVTLFATGSEVHVAVNGLTARPGLQLSRHPGAAHRPAARRREGDLDPRSFIILEGLHGYATPRRREYYDLK